jgi:tripartite-type tricarboxylate transporter receptor subunit TctC
LHLAAGAAALPAVSRIARAQAYPTRNVTLIVPFAAGGGSDTVARIVSEHMSRTLRQQFIIENVAGAGGTIASTRVMRANPDGHTIQLGHMGTHAVAASVYPNLAYRPPATNLAEFISYAKANADRLNMAHAGVGSNSFSFGSMLNHILGLKPTLVPFNGNAPAINALLGGQVDYLCGTSFTEVGQQVQSGLLKAYAFGGNERHPALPTVPTFMEAGLPEFQDEPGTPCLLPRIRRDQYSTS